ncbi:MAG: hypothetical protein FJ290_20780, partial [Planctomycetes bacterium]|nr:hypothetical protein [Planctomycetota bacterium]
MDARERGRAAWLFLPFIHPSNPPFIPCKVGKTAVNVLAHLHRLDRRWLYLASAIALAVPFLVRARIPMPPTQP